MDTGLDAYEYEAGNGIAAGEETLRAIGAAARAAGTHMSFHTPYFIFVPLNLIFVDIIICTLDALDDVIFDISLRVDEYESLSDDTLGVFHFNCVVAVTVNIFGT